MTVVFLENLSQNALSKIKTIGETDGVRSRHDFNFTQPTLNTQLLLTGMRRLTNQASLWYLLYICYKEHNRKCIPFRYLQLYLQINNDKTKRFQSICLQVNVDSLGFLFTETVDHRIEIQHEATFDAFAFVQAYKRHGRFTLHNHNFNFISNIKSNRNAHIYFHYADKRKIKVQTLFD